MCIRQKVLVEIRVCARHKTWSVQKEVGVLCYRLISSIEGGVTEVLSRRYRRPIIGEDKGLKKEHRSTP